MKIKKQCFWCKRSLTKEDFKNKNILKNKVSQCFKCGYYNMRLSFKKNK